jgi:hypothetical protein
MECINCSTDSSDKFCPSCGQRMAVKRLTFKEGFYDFGARIYGFDGQFPRTLRDITLRPGVAAKRFIEGNRALYYGPVGYYFLMITVMLLVASILGIDFNEAMMSRARDIAQTDPSEKAAEAQHILQGMVLDNFKWFSFALVFFVTLWLRVLFRRSGYNLLEHSVMPFYVMGHFYWLSILEFILSKAFGLNINQYFVFLIYLLYLGYGSMNLYTYQSGFKAFLKGMLSFALAMVGMFILMAIILIMYILVDPEFAKALKPEKVG